MYEIELIYSTGNRLKLTTENPPVKTEEGYTIEGALWIDWKYVITLVCTEIPQKTEPAKKQSIKDYFEKPRLG